MTCWLCGFKTTELATNTTASVCKNDCQICTAVAKVDEEINQAVTVLRRLLDKRRDLRTEQNRAHDPMNRLPVEIRNRTFELALPRWDEWGDTIQVEGVLPSLLSSVCRSWRDIALSNPFLWTTIRIPLGERLSIDFLHNLILHSGTLPLTLHIEVVDRVEQSRKDMAPVLDAMSLCSNRLQSLSLDDLFPTLYAFQRDNLPWHRLTQLRILSSIRAPDRSLPFLNPTASPGKIVINIPTKSLRISWKGLTSATVDNMDLEDLALLFQHASQMTECHVLSLDYGPDFFLMPPIIHHRLKTFTLRNVIDSELAISLLDSLTVPCLQEFHINDMSILMYLPSLVHRSSCPLTSLTLYNDLYLDDDYYIDIHFQSLPGVTDVVVETTEQQEHTMIKKVLEGCFPNLYHLTLRLQPFLWLWEMGVIALLLERKRLQPGGPNEGRLLKILVVEQNRASEFARMWKSEVGERLIALGIKLREDGFEFL